MKRPSFEYPICEHCGALVEKLQVEQTDAGNYRITVHCHDRRTMMILTSEDIEAHGGNPLVKLRAFKPA